MLGQISIDTLRRPKIVTMEQKNKHDIKDHPSLSAPETHVLQLVLQTDRQMEERRPARAEMSSIQGERTVDSSERLASDNADALLDLCGRRIVAALLIDTRAQGISQTFTGDSNDTCHGSRIPSRLAVGDEVGSVPLCILQ